MIECGICGFKISTANASQADMAHAVKLYNDHNCTKPAQPFTWPMAAVCIVMGLVIGYIAELIVGLLGS